MEPAKPPLAVPSSLPFQFAVGIQTSRLMCESDDGVATAATRQNAGTSVPPPRPPAGLNGPAGTSVADAILTSGIVSDVRLAHVVRACARSPPAARLPSNNAPVNDESQRIMVSAPAATRAEAQAASRLGRRQTSATARARFDRHPASKNRRRPMRSEERRVGKEGRARS